MSPDRWREVATEVRRAGMSPNAAAQHVLDSAGLGRVDDVIYVQEVADELGFRIRHWQLAKAYGLSGKLEFDAGVPVLFARADRRWEDRRLILARDLGHLMLHVSLSGQVAGSLIKASDKHEKEATQFAASFLIPEWRIRAFTAHFPTYVPPFHEIVRSFGVPDSLLRYRLRELGLSGLVLN